MIYTYHDSGISLPDGITGNVVEIKSHQFSGSAHMSPGLVTATEYRMDVSRKKAFEGRIVDMTPAEATIMDAFEQNCAQVVAESDQRKKSYTLKKAENMFLQCVSECNSALRISISVTDRYQDILTKIESSGAVELEKLKWGSRLQTLWNAVVAEGGKYGDIQYHQEVD